MIIEVILIILGALTSALGIWNLVIGAYVWGALFILGGIWSIWLGVLYIIQAKREKAQEAESKNVINSHASDASLEAPPMAVEDGILTQDLFANPYDTSQGAQIEDTAVLEDIPIQSPPQTNYGVSPVPDQNMGMPTPEANPYMAPAEAYYNYDQGQEIIIENPKPVAQSSPSALEAEARQTEIQAAMVTAVEPSSEANESGSETEAAPPTSAEIPVESAQANTTLEDLSKAFEESTEMEKSITTVTDISPALFSPEQNSSETLEDHPVSEMVSPEDTDPNEAESHRLSSEPETGEVIQGASTTPVVSESPIPEAPKESAGADLKDATAEDVILLSGEVIDKAQPKREGSLPPLFNSTQNKE